MNKDEMIMKLREVIVNDLGHKVPEQLNETDRLFDDLYIDSIMVLQLIVYMEETLNLTVPEENVDPDVFQTVGTLIHFFAELQGVEI